MNRRHAAINKISFPVLPEIVPRRRLFRLLDQRRTHTVTWISGMAGAGKTTLAASYLNDSRAGCIWYQLDEGDSDLSTFFYYLGLAARSVAPPKKHPLPLFTAEYFLGASTFSKRYFEDLCSRFKAPYFLVFDDYHALPPESPFHEIFREGLSRLGRNVHVIILSRKDPPPTFAGMLAKNSLRIIGGQDLLLNVSESGKILRTRVGRPVARETAARIHAKTHGWAAGIVLMAKSIHDHAHSPEVPELSTPEEIFSYFAGEFFATIDESTQDFLIRTAILPRMTAPMAQALTGQVRAKTLLAELERSHLFIEKTGSPLGVYRYHPLFREFLLSRAEACLAPDEIDSLRKKAAYLLADAGYIEDAVDLFAQAGLTTALTALIHQQAGSLMEQGRNRTLENWISRIPVAVLHRAPWMSYWLGMSRRHACPAEARTSFMDAFGIFEKQGDLAGALLSWSGIIESTLYEWHDFTVLDPWIAWLEDHLRSAQPFPAPEIEARVTVSMMCALMFRRPDRQDMTLWVERALCLARRHGDIRLRIEAWDWAITYYCWLGNFARARILKEESTEAMQTYLKIPAVMLHTRWLDVAARIFNDVPDHTVLEEISEALDMGEKTGIRVWDHMFLTIGIFTALMTGNTNKARDFLQRLRAGLDSSRYHGHALYHMSLALYSLLGQDTASALEHARTASVIAEETGYLFPLIICRYALVQILVETGSFDEAETELDEVFTLCRLTRSVILEFMCLVAKAHLALKQGLSSEARGYLQEAMGIGRIHNFRNMIWWWQPAMMSEILIHAQQAGIEAAYVRNLIRIHRVVPGDFAYSIEDWPWPVKISTLGGFEIAKDDETMIFAGKAHKKPFELLKVLLAHGGRGVSIGRITDTLWPEADGDLAHSSFSTTLNRLRALMDNRDALEHRDGRLSLNQDICWVDSWAFTALLENAGRLRVSGEPQDTINLYERALSLYRGHFLQEETDHAWIITPRRQLQNLFVEGILKLGRHLEEEQDYEKAIAWFLKGTEADPTEEGLYQSLMTCYHLLGQPSGVEKSYLQCRTMLETILGVEPSHKTREIYERARKP